MYPAKLKNGDEVRIIAPSCSMATIPQEAQRIANQCFSDLGLKLSFGKHIEEKDDFDSSSIESRVQDIHEAFSDENVKAIIPVVGGFNSNQLLRYLDWDLIKNNPKIFCGYSDITALNNAIFTKTGLVSYCGPNYSTFGQEFYLDYTLEYFKKCLFSKAPFEIISSKKWSDDDWQKDQKERNLISNDGFSIINKGRASGTIIGTNLCTLNLLQGTEYFPSLANSILFIEDDEESLSHHFDRDLQSLLHLPDFKNVKGVVIGRFQKASKITVENISKIIKTKKELEKLPVIANVDFGHTEPKSTFPIGGEVSLVATNGKIVLEILKH
ncbi:MAG: S66 peptidase family protein [Patescibacteria group bacterium]